MRPVPLPPLRLTHVTHWSLPNNDPATIQLIQTLSALAELGVLVELLSPRPPWRAARPQEALRRELAEHYGASCRFAPREVPVLLPWLPWLSRLPLAAFAAAAARSSRSDVLHTRDLEAAWVGLRAGRRVVFEAYRVWSRVSGFHRRRLLRMARRPGFLGLVTHSRFAAEGYRQDGVPAAKVRAIYNGYDPKLFATIRSAAEARQALGMPEAPTVVYLGAIAEHKRVDLLLDAAERTPEVRWVLAGDHRRAGAEPIVARATTLPNVTLAGYVGGEQLALVLQAGELLVNPPSAEPLERFGRTVLPMKMFQYLAAGRPIVTGDMPDTAELLIQDRNAVRVRPDDPEALAEAVRALLGDEGRRQRLGEAARRDAAGYTWAARGEAFLGFLRERLAAVGVER